MKIKDELYYDDLKYFIIKTANLPYKDDKNKNIIIEQRMRLQKNNTKDEITNKDIPYFTISSFESDFFKFVNYINKITGDLLESPYDLFMYKNIVSEHLDKFILDLKNEDIIYLDSDKKHDNIISKNKK